jgi:hypothetical protein
MALGGPEVPGMKRLAADAERVLFGLVRSDNIADGRNRHRKTVGCI